ncbi:asparagine synthase [Peribacillus simplex]|uniref:asparagine synthase n=1 Tax=Peribacillus simplex TaxID=1478 RepID=UPI003D2AEE9B
MDICEGLIPIALGTAVKADVYATKQNRPSNKMVVNGLVHVVLGVIDLVLYRG